MTDDNFWLKLPQPFFVLAPMLDVTDSAFRQVIATCAKPDVFFTEFVSVAGLTHPQAGAKLRRELYFTPGERPVVAQLFGNQPEKFFQASQLVAELGFAGVDINLGCPDQTIVKQGAGAALINEPALVKEIILATKEGAGHLPVSLKTRLGYHQPDYLPWFSELLSCRPAVITVHLRTKKEMSLVPAHWEVVPDLVKLFAGSGVLLVANGDVGSLAQARQLAEQHQLAGVMLGRAIFGRPYLFAETEPILSPAERATLMLQHLNLFADLYLPGPTNDRLFAGHTKSLALLKKHFNAYARGFAGASAWRTNLMQATGVDDLRRLLAEFLPQAD